MIQTHDINNSEASGKGIQKVERGQSSINRDLGGIHFADLTSITVIYMEKRIIIY